MVKNLVQDAEHVAQNDDGHEDGAFADDHLRPQCSDDGKRPAACKTQQHQYFKNTDIHCFIMIFTLYYNSAKIHFLANDC